MEYFTLNELTFTHTGIMNIPDEAATKNLQYLMNQLLCPVREAWGGPIRVNSGYRSPAVNAAVKGAPASQHLKGEAADITVGSKAGNRALFDLIRNNGLVFDQLIDEKDYSWLHVSLKREGKNRGQVLHLS